MTRSFGAAPLGLMLLALAAAPAPGAERRAAAEIACTPTPKPLAYDCTVRLQEARSGAPLAGATLTIGADMPSMPLAHNVRPALAAPSGEPGTYRAEIALEMHGEWALKLDIGGPFRDRLVEVLRFEEGSATWLRKPRPGGEQPAR